LNRDPVLGRKPVLDRKPRSGLVGLLSPAVLLRPVRVPVLVKLVMPVKRAGCRPGLAKETARATATA
jgi:hypothetical protein